MWTCTAKQSASRWLEPPIDFRGQGTSRYADQLALKSCLQTVEDAEPSWTLAGEVRFFCAFTEQQRAKQALTSTSQSVSCNWMLLNFDIACSVRLEFATGELLGDGMNSGQSGFGNMSVVSADASCGNKGCTSLARVRVWVEAIVWMRWEHRL